jgi:hypothetical protein
LWYSNLSCLSFVKDGAANCAIPSSFDFFPRILFFRTVIALIWRRERREEDYNRFCAQLALIRLAGFSQELLAMQPFT